MTKEKFDVIGMSCAACVSHVEKSVKKLEGVQEVQVSLLTNSMVVRYDDALLDPTRIMTAVDKAGYQARLQNAAAQAKPESTLAEDAKRVKRRLIASIAILVVLLYVSMHQMLGLPGPAFLHGQENALSFAFLQFLLTLPILFLNRKYYESGLKSLIHGAPNMDTLIAMGSGAALLYGIYAIFRIGYGLGWQEWEVVNRYRMDLYFESSAMILTLITLGKYLESRSRSKTGEAIEKLMKLAPESAWVIRNGVETEIPVGQVVVGDVVLVRPGQRVPVDGTIKDGLSAFDESAMTGESMPVEKQPGDPVSAGVINKTGSVRITVTRVGEDTTLSQMIRLVEEAAISKAPIAKTADKVASVFVPAVMGIALVAGVIWLLVGQTFEFAMSTAIAVLVVSCPCALGLATPVAIMAGTGRGAEMGILVKSAQALEILHGVRTVVMDKTGTITQGRPVVTDLITLGMQEDALLSMAAALEEPSEHLLAEAVLQKTRERGVVWEKVTEFAAEPGRGVGGNWNGLPCLAGNAAMMQAHGIDVMPLQQRTEQLAQQGKTPLYFACNGKLAGAMAVADVPKSTSREAIAALQKQGIRVVMLTGDHPATAHAIGEELGIRDIYAQVLPNQKERIVAELQQNGKNRVAMIGDGVNDAPALARADVGIAIGAGTDIAIDSADVVLMRSDLNDVVTAWKLSRSVMRNIKQNLFWAFFYNCIGIPLAAGVFYSAWGWKLSPIFGAAAMSLSSIFVVGNALRLRWFRPKGDKQNRTETEQTQQTEQTQRKEEPKMMTKEMKIEGMSCMHCVARVEKALNGLEGVEAKVDLDKKTAFLTLNQDVADQKLVDAVTDAGYDVVEVK